MLSSAEVARLAQPTHITTSGGLISATFIEHIRWPIADALVFAPR